MGTFGPMHWIVIIVLALLLFGGGGKISSMMGDAAKGVKAFKDGLKEDGKDGEAEPKAKPVVSVETDGKEPR